MKSKSIISSVFLALILISCDSSMLIKVDLSGELSNQNYSLIDYDFVLAQSNDSDNLYFEFVTNNELEQTTPITFIDQSGNVIAAKEVGSANNLISEDIEISGERSFAYSINLVDLRSVSLVHEVIIGN
jgi:hypothetical protein